MKDRATVVRSVESGDGRSPLRCPTSAVTIFCTELMYSIRKSRFDLTNAPLKITTAPSIETAVLSAH